MKICPKCHTENVTEANFCKRCGTPIVDVPDRETEQSDMQDTFSGGSQKKTIYDSVNAFVDNTTAHVDVHLRDLYSNVFKHHTMEEAEDIFICGTSRTTPLLQDVSSSWPKPWLYSRVLFAMLVAFSLLRFGLTTFQNPNLLPGLILIGSFAVPFSVVIFFMEVNAFRNVSFYNVLRIFLVGGCASLIVTLFLYAFTGAGSFDLFGAMMVGVVEEVGKMIIIYYFIAHYKRCNFILSGMLIGAAVGAGFAAFESAGYANNTSDLSNLLDIIYLRGILAPGGHVVWSAITGAAIMLVKSNKQMQVSMIFQAKFLRVFILPIVLHGCWDWAGLDSFGEMKFVVLIVIAWVIAIALINRGLIEVRKYQHIISENEKV